MDCPWAQNGWSRSATPVDGDYGRVNAEVLADEAIVAVCDLDIARADQVAAIAGGARVFTDWREMLDQAELDALWICTPLLAAPRSRAWANQAT